MSTELNDTPVSGDLDTPDETVSTPDNMALWTSLERTDPAATSIISGGQMNGKTSINSLWCVRKATEAFGPVGDGWNFKIIKDEFIDGMPIGESGVFTKTHTMHVKVTAWYHGRKLKSIGIGHTPYITAKGHVDGEYAKKSLSDALKNAMKMFGISADIYEGQFDDPTYRKEVEDETAIQKAEDKEAEIARQRDEYESHYARAVEQMASSPTLNELQALYNSTAKKVAKWSDVKRASELQGVWMDRAHALVQVATGVEHLEAIYKAVAKNAKLWGTPDKVESIKADCAARKAQLTETAA